MGSEFFCGMTLPANYSDPICASGLLGDELASVLTTLTNPQPSFPHLHARIIDLRPWAQYNNVFGVWRSPVAHLVWDQGVQGSNPCTPTKY